MKVDIEHTFVTSDHHFLSWKNCYSFMQVFTQDEEKTLIDNWNSVVKDDDLVLYVGDFVDAISVKDLADTRKKLNGDIILIKGNHDDVNNNIYRSVFKDVVDVLELEDLNIYLKHTPDEHVRNGWKQIFGHVHRNVKCDELFTKSSFCSCVQMNNGFPVKLVDVIEKMGSY